MRLTNTQVKSATPKDKPYKLSDGGGMFLLVRPNGSKYWRLSYRYEGKQKTFAIGVYPELSIAAARSKRSEIKEQLLNGIDPSAQRKLEKFESNQGTTFEEVARKWYASNKTWSDSHRQRVIRSMERYLFPFIGNSLIKDLKTKDLLLPVQRIIDEQKYDTATDIQQRIGAVMRYAVQRGIIDYNAALDTVGYVPSVKTKHRPALDLVKLPEFLGRIDSFNGRLLTQLAVKLTLLTFVRSSELRFARWSEFDLEKGLWTIPGTRKAIKDVKFSHRGSKMKTPHLVPLSKQSLKIMRTIYGWSGDRELVFVSDSNFKKVMSENTVNSALRSMGYDTQNDVCGHGFRTMACSALIESGIWDEDAVERQMSHQERNSVRAAYTHKAEFFDQRSAMMQWWGDYLDANRQEYISPFDFAKINKGLKN